jgi:hypothetical protein
VQAFFDVGVLASMRTVVLSNILACAHSFSLHACLCTCLLAFWCENVLASGVLCVQPSLSAYVPPCFLQVCLGAALHACLRTVVLVCRLGLRGGVLACLSA